MEPDLDRLLDYESLGGLFPQFQETWDAVFSAARAFAEQVRLAGEGRLRVAVWIADPQRFCALFLALAREEVDLFLCNPSWGRAERDAAESIANAHWMARASGQGDFAFTPAKGVPFGERIELGRNALRVMIPTGGSSGQVRFATHDWSTLAAASYGFQQHFSCDTVTAHCLLPLYHVSGLMQLVRALLTNGSVVFGRLQDFGQTHRLLDGSDRESRFLSLVGTQLERLLRDAASPERLRDYRAVLVGGGPVAIGLLESARYLEIPLAPTYGMTETAAQVATLLPKRFLEGHRGQGQALPHAHIDIVDEGECQRVLPAGELGRIRVRALSLFRGYAGEAMPMAGGIFLTSDLGRMDEFGYLTVLGRADRVVITGGEKVHLREVEVAIERSNLVRDVVAFGVSDAQWGEKLAVAFAPHADWVEEGAIRAFLQSELASFKMPKLWIRKKEIPRNEAGKPLLSELKVDAAG